jgi:hypothetical protein
MSMMQNSRMPDEWVRDAVARNPVQKMANGNYRTCPVRLAFAHVVKPNPHAKNDDGTPKDKPSYEVTALFPPGGLEQLNAVLWPDIIAALRADFPANFNAQTGQPFGLHCPPWRDQAEKQQYAGYTPGLPFARMTTQFKPQIVDPAMNPIVDEGRVYAGVWAILAFNTFVFGKSPPRPKKGLSLGLQSVMIIADDEKLAGGAPDAAEQFAGVSVSAQFDPGSAFGAPPGAPAAPSIMPPPRAVAPGVLPPPSLKDMGLG